MFRLENYRRIWIKISVEAGFCAHGNERRVLWKAGDLLTG